MRVRNIKNKKEILNESSYYLANPEEYKGKWNKPLLRKGKEKHHD